MTILIIIATISLFLFLLFFVLRNLRSYKGDKKKENPWNDEHLLRKTGKKTTTRNGANQKKCPLCGTVLSPGERVHSVVYSGGAPSTNLPVIESMTHMFGCPHCSPKPSIQTNAAGPRKKRTCPSCKSTLQNDDYVIARMFDNKQTKKKQLRVIGCTQCRKSTKISYNK